MSSSNIDAKNVVGAAQILAENRTAILAALNNTKRRLTAQFNDSKRKEDEEKCALVESISDLCVELARLNRSIDTQKKERAQYIETNRRKEEQDHAFAFENILQTLKGTYQMRSDDHKRILEGMYKDLTERQRILKSKQSAQLEALQPPRELAKSLTKYTNATERCMFEIESMSKILHEVVDAEYSAFHTEIIQQESLDRNTIFNKEETRLLQEKRVEEENLQAIRAKLAKEKGEMELAIAQLILQQRQLQGDAEMYLQIEIRQIEKYFDQHQKEVAEKRFKRTAAYKVEKVKGLGFGVLNAGIINPLKFVAKSTMEVKDAIIPRHEAPPSSAEIERRSEEKRMLREQCQSYLEGLRAAIDNVSADTHWMEQQTELVKAMLCNDELGVEQMGARMREILQRRRPAQEDDDEESETLGRTFSASRRSVSSLHSSRTGGW